jgi:bifunctional DNase/RNase
MRPEVLRLDVRFETAATSTMIEVVIDSIRVSLMSQYRVVILKDVNSDRYVPIWIGPCEADAITIELQDMPPQRPLTHDLLKNVIRELGGNVVHIFINDLRSDVYFARIVIDVKGTQIEIDSRPSDAIALAVRVKAPIFVSDTVMERAVVEPEEDVERSAPPNLSEIPEDQLSAFKDFVNSLDLDDLDDEDE